MFLKKIEIVKYKNIENVTIDLSKDNIVSIVGINNIGKSNILEAINFFELKEIKNKREKTENENIIFHFEIDEKELKNTYFNEYIQEELLKSINYKEILNNLQLYSTNETFQKQKMEIELSIENECEKNWRELKNFQITIKSYKNKYDEYWPIFVVKSIILTNMLRNIVIPKIHYFDNTKKSKFLKNKFEINDSWFKQLLFVINMEDFVTSFFTFDSILQVEKLEDLNDKITAFFFNDWNQSNNSDYASNITILNENKQEFEFKIIDKKNSNLNFKPEESSDGLSAHLILKIELGSASFQNRLIVIDEPNTFLHPIAQSNLLNYFKNVVNKNNKIIFSTHSEHMLDLNISILHKDKNNFKWIQEKPKDIDEFYNIQLESLTNNILLNNPISKVIKNNNDYLNIITQVEQGDYGSALTKLNSKLEDQLNILVEKINNSLSESKYKDYETIKKLHCKTKLNFILDKWPTNIKNIIKIGNEKEVVLDSFIQTNIKNISILLDIRNNLSDSHPNQISDQDFEYSFDIIWSSYRFTIEMLKRINKMNNFDFNGYLKDNGKKNAKIDKISLEEEILLQN